MNLNHEAQEWRPNSASPLQSHELLPHVLLTPPLPVPPPPQQVVALTASAPLKPLYQFPCHPQPFSYMQYPPQGYYQHRNFIPYHVYTQSQHCYYVSTLAEEDCLDTAAKVAEAVSWAGAEDVGYVGEMIDPTEENGRNSMEKKVESPNNPLNDVVYKGFKRVNLPPRLQRVVRYFRVNKTPPPPPPPRKLEWRPKKSRNPVFNVPGYGGATLPPPPSQDDLSHSTNTTVMVKNIPNQLRRGFMMKFLDIYCKEHSLAYDVLYLPMDFRKRDNLGYCFVNFTTTTAAKIFKQVLHNYKWDTTYTEGGRIASKKICEISWARVQGKEALIKRFQNAGFHCDSLDFLPVVLDPPRNGLDPNPPPPVVLGKLYPPPASRKIH